MTDDKTRAECEEWVQKSIKKEHDPIDINDVYAAWQAAKELYAPREVEIEKALRGLLNVISETRGESAYEAVKYANEVLTTKEPR